MERKRLKLTWGNELLYLRAQNDSPVMEPGAPTTGIRHWENATYECDKTGLDDDLGLGGTF